MTEEVGLARLAGIVRRHKLPVALIAVMGTALGLYLVKRAPKTYQARAVMRIEDPRPSREYVNSTVNEPSGERLKSRRLTFLARPVVLAAAAKADMMPADATDAEKDELAAAIAGRLDARQEGEDTFVITYQDGDPTRAQAFLDALTASYTEMRAQEMTVRATETAEFFGRQVSELRPRVASADATLEKFRLANHGSLPEELESNLRMLDETQMEAHSVRASLDASLARRMAFLADAQSPIRRQEEEAARALTTARARYAAGSSEVKNLEAELARVRVERREDEGDLKKRMRRSPELAAMEVASASMRTRLDELKVRENALRGRIDAAAGTSEELAKLALERDILRDRLKNLLAKHEEASLSAALEADIAGRARVTVIEPAFASAQAVKPAKPFLAALAIALAFGLALGVGFVLDAMDRRVRTPADIRVLAGDLPILGVVPHMSARDRDPKWNKRPQA